MSYTYWCFRFLDSLRSLEMTFSYPNDSSLLEMTVKSACYMIISFNTPDAVWYAPAPAPWITSGDG